MNKTLGVFLILSLVALATLFLSFRSPQSKSTPMYQFEQEDYAEEWQEIEKLEQNGLPKSALEKVEVLYSKAKEGKNPAQLIKTLLYKIKYIQQLEENGAIKAIKVIEEDLETASFPERAILQSIAGSQYSSYLKAQFWQLDNRTNRPGFQSDDITTWSVEQFIEKAASYFEASIEEEQLLQIQLNDLAAILVSKEETNQLRPTLYDFLAHRAIEFFSDDWTYITEPVYEFQLDQEVAFAPAKDFVAATFSTKDSSSLKYKNLLLLQKVIAKHLEDEDPAALIDADLQRLRFAYRNAANLPKDTLLVQTLDDLFESYKKHSAAAEILYFRAEHYRNRAEAYAEEEEGVKKWGLKEAMELCEKALTDYPETFGAKNCAAVKALIQEQSLDLKTEQVVPTDQPILAMLEYRNTPKIYAKLIKLSEAERETYLTKKLDKRLAYLQKLKPYRTLEQALPDPGDYQRHRVEIKIDALPLGHYAILFSDDKQMDVDKTLVGTLFLDVSNIAYQYRRDENGDFNFVLTDRTSGKPLEGVTAEYFVDVYSRNYRRMVPKLMGTAVSDADGFIRTTIGKNGNFYPKFRKGDDLLFHKATFRNAQGREGREVQETHFFMDRGIYRPGQTVYFKAIVLEKDSDENPRALPNQKVSITLMDVNYQEVHSLQLMTNAYGTINGSFVLPEGNLNGQFHLRSDAGNSRKYFRVEEYKRPKFEVQFEPLEGSFQLDDEVTVSAKAKAYAGSMIDGAKVQYRVVREVRFPWYYRRSFFPSFGNEVEITSGQTATDAQGQFKINFNALSDPTVSKDRKPLYTFTVYADVTDITGETRSARKSIQLGFNSLLLDLSIDEQVDRSQKRHFPISTKNLDGNKEPTEVIVEVYQLDAPERFFYKRFWSKPDQFIMTQGAFKEAFPNFAYKDEDEQENWPSKSLQYTATINTGYTDSLSLDLKDWPIGHFKIILKAKDQNGREVELQKYFSLMDEAAQALPASTILWKKLSADAFEPGDTAMLKIGSGCPEMMLLVELEKQGKILSSAWLSLKNSEPWLNLKTKISEADRGNIHWNISAVYQNRFHKFSKLVKVPWTNKQLHLEFSTFRDKIQPGAAEEWTIKISGPEKEIFAAEMVASMYDASLDVFAGNSWGFDPFPVNYSPNFAWNVRSFGANNAYTRSRRSAPRADFIFRSYPSLNWFAGSELGLRGNAVRKNRRLSGVLDYSAQNEVYAAEEPAPTIMRSKASGGSAMAADSLPEADMESTTAPPPPPGEENAEDIDLGEVPIRTNLDETVFFMPDLHTDEEGNVLLKFEMNEALTRWKFLGFAHTPDLKSGLLQEEVITQKELMVLPNAPRFVREGDELEFTAKVSNLTEEMLNGQATLQLFDAITMQPVDTLFANANNVVSFSAGAGQSARLAWKIKVPEEGINALTHRVIAKAGQFSDGEESAIPVLTNRMLVTESMPLPVKGGETKQFNFGRMAELGQSETLKNHRFTLEFTSNPAWYAVQALPYLMEYPYECTEQIFNRYYANSLATQIANSKPEIQQIFDSWKDTEALESNLSKNEELKSLLLKETPWVLDAQSEAEQKKNIGLLFDLTRMAKEQAATLQKLSERQASSGAWSWFPGGTDSWYITQYVVEGLGHLKELGVESLAEGPNQDMLPNAIQFIDEELLEEYKQLERLVKQGHTKWEEDHLSHMIIHYLYARSFFPNIQMDQQTAKVVEYYQGLADKYWVEKGLYQQGMLALGLQRANKTKTPAKIVASLKERALHNEELGMYWKYPSGYYWHQLPIETHALLTEVFAEVAKDDAAVAELKQWLLKNKQTNAWKTTKATAASIYALLHYGDDWLTESEPVTITFDKNPGQYSQQITEAQKNAEAGTGYFKTDWEGKEISEDLSSLRISNPNKGIAWGGIYWQYFEQLDKITTFEETPLQLKKQVFKEVASDTGPILREINSATDLSAGDKVIIRIELRVDRPMEYVHMKDMRASGLEPINVLSRYKWQGGLGYYESTGDAATNFFFDYLPKGTFVFEYPLRVFHQGNFSNGVTSIQCMYAPEFSSHSEGIRIEVED